MEQTGLAWLGLAKLVIYFVEICVGTSGLSLLELDIIIAMHFTVRHYTGQGGHLVISKNLLILKIWFSTQKQYSKNQTTGLNREKNLLK